MNYKRKRPEFPEKAVVTAGMPYGNKNLHFGHIGGMMIHADIFSRFLRDRIGKDNVIFVSGTDCYGSPIIASYKKHIDTTNEKISLEEYVMNFHKHQKKVIEDYEIGFNLFATSAFGRAGEIHKEVSSEVFNELYSNGFLKKITAPQFYDTEFNEFLNGRQVIGKCPFEGCKSEKAYADECGLGHQYMPSELIEPKSILSGKKPELRDVTNWYFNLDEYQSQLKEMVRVGREKKHIRKYILDTTDEFLKDPVIYVKRSEVDKMNASNISLSVKEILDEEKKPSVTYVFNNLDERDLARQILDSNNIRYRTGKTLVPFRLSGNIDWGIPVPSKENLDNLTFWVWPESLWAPISFTRTYLESIGKKQADWKQYWLSDNSKVYQFIGEDNIYFYGIAEMGMFMALRGTSQNDNADIEALNLPHLVANNHLLFMDKKASSSSDIKPPMAHELLEHYTNEQLRMHFLSLGLSKKSVSFNPKVYQKDSDDKSPDTVLKDGNLLTNVYNRLIRSCFYTNQKYFGQTLPVGEISDEILNLSEKAILDYESHMYRHELHNTVFALDSYLRKVSKYWSKNMKIADDSNNNEIRKQVLIDTFHCVRVAMTLLHPIAPSGTENIKNKLNLSDKVWSWEYIFEPINIFIDSSNEHKCEFLEPKYDFFKKHPSQLKF